MRKICFLFFFSLFISAAMAGPWAQKASMGGLGRHRAFSMSIGNHGYVGGGWNGNTMYYDFWDYDPATNSWTQKANLPTYLWSDPAFGIGTKGYVMDNGITYMYLPYNNTWSTVNTSSPSATYYDQLKFVINGRGYLTDGTYIYEFNPVGYIWTIRTTFPTAFYGDIAFGIGNKGYFIDTYYNTMMEYDPATNLITYKAPCPGVMSQGTSWAVNGKGYAGLGQVPPNYTDEQQVYEYNPATNTWKGINDFEGAGRENATAFVINTMAYVSCGTCGINMNDLWEFDNANVTGVPEENASANISLFPNPSADGKFNISCGSGGVRIGEVQVYDRAGRLVKREANAGSVIDLGTLENGVYSFVFYDEAQHTLGVKNAVLKK
jgi:N-acetylneuraminic acid mutarotase